MLSIFFPILQDGRWKTEKRDTKEKKPEAQKADAGSRAQKDNLQPRRLRRRSPTTAETLSWPEELAGIPSQLCSPKRPCTTRKYSLAKSRIEKQKKEKVLATVTKPVGGDKNGGAWVVTLHKMPQYYPTEEAPQKLLSHGEETLQSACEKTAASITPGPILILTGHHRRKRVVFLKQQTCYLWLDLCPSIEALCVEHKGKLSLSPPPTLISVVWKSPNISEMLTSRRRLDIRRGRSLTQRKRSTRVQSSTR